MPTIGPLELIVILIIALIVFGPKRLPELGASLGRGIKEFRNSVSGAADDDSHERSQPRPELDRAKQSAEGSTEPVDGEIVTDDRN